MSTSTALRPGMPAPPTRTRTVAVLGGATASVAVLLGLLLVSSGVGASESVRITAVLAVQMVTGILLWRLARGPVASGVAEVVGAGLALGTLGSLLGAQLLLPLGFGDVGWLLPTALVLAGAALPGPRGRLRAGRVRAPALDEVGALLGGIAVGLVFVRSFWRRHPLEWTGWWEYYLDIPHHEALSVSLSTWGPGDHILVAGDPLRYHWFAHAWAGAVSDASSAGSFVVVTRVLPLVALLGTVCLAWAWAVRLSDRRATPLLAVLLTTLAVNVGTRADLDYLQVFTLSPSQALTAVWFLAAALVHTEFLRERIGGGPALLAFLAAGCMGGKTSFAAVLVGGVGMTALAALWQPHVRARAWQALAVTVVASGGAFAAVILGSTGNLRLEAGLTAQTFGILPDRTWAGIAVGTLAAALLFSAKWAGLGVLLTARRTAAQPEVWFGVGVLGTALLLMAALGHPGNSQLWFPSSAGVALAVLSAWGLAEAPGRVHPGWLWTAVVAGAAAGAAGLAGLPGAPAWADPYGVWSVPLLLALAVLASGILGRARPGARGPAGLRRAAASVLAWGLVAASVLTGVASAAATELAPRPAAAAPDGSLAWTESHETALRWLRDNSDEDDVVITNRHCAAPQPAFRPCTFYRWFLTAALGQRRMYVEGADYAAGDPHPDWVDERIELSQRFVESPRRADAEVLWEAGVRWVVVDLASTGTRDWAPYAEPAFATETTEILRLGRP